MSIEEIKDVLKENLEKRGVLNKIRANLRAEIFRAFEDDDGASADIASDPDFWLRKQKAKPKPSDMQFLINELIIEYLEFNHMNYSKSVFTKESNQPEERLDKKFLAHELNIRKTYEELEDDQDENEPIPLLYTILHRLRNENVREKRKDMNKQQPTRAIFSNQQSVLIPPAVRDQQERATTSKPKPQVVQKRLDTSSISTDSSASSKSERGLPATVTRKISDALQNSKKLQSLPKEQVRQQGNQGIDTHLGEQRRQMSSRIFAVGQFDAMSSIDSNNAFIPNPDQLIRKIPSGLPSSYFGDHDSSMNSSETY